MGDFPSLFTRPAPPPPTPHPPPSQKINLPMLYYGLVIVGTAAIVLAVYNLIIIKWCSQRPGSQSDQRPNRYVEATTNSQSLEPNGSLLSSFKYKKNNSMGAQDQGSDNECAVCLSVFEEEEEVKQLPRCKHSFHAPCIDMWLYSHSDCPLCRAHVDPPSLCHRHVVVDRPENSRVESGMAV